ncbi:excinuclease ABC subunit C [Candidatus Falkowbacteria bacterium]|nr:MAG: excinuclease ABC subunit C [Candidatus Falkowbacteria bacterium]
MGYVYFLKLSNNDIYIGSTKNLNNRLLNHKKGEVKATMNLLPVKLLAYIAVPRETHARRLEKYFKTGSGRAVLKKRILTDEALA